MSLLNEIKNIKSGRRELRDFCLVIGTALAILGGIMIWRQKDNYLYLFIVSVVFYVAGFTIPNIMKPLFKIWMGFAVVMGWIMTRVILSVLFYFVITPIGLLSKLCGNHFLDLKADKSARTYWKPRVAKEYNKEDYERQF